MLKNIVRLVIIVPAAVLVVTFAVANRQWVTVSLDPLGGSDPALSLSMPLFLLVLLSIMAGIVLGGVAAWIRQGHVRKAARAASREAARWREEAEQSRRRGEQAVARPALAAPEVPARKAG